MHLKIILCQICQSIFIFIFCSSWFVSICLFNYFRCHLQLLNFSPLKCWYSLYYRYIYVCSFPEQKRILWSFMRISFGSSKFFLIEFLIVKFTFFLCFLAIHQPIIVSYILFLCKIYLDCYWNPCCTSILIIA